MENVPTLANTPMINSELSLVNVQLKALYDFILPADVKPKWFKPWKEKEQQQRWHLEAGNV